MSKIYNIFTTTISLTARLILFVMGWNRLSDKMSKRMNSVQRGVLIFSHTSYIDGLIFFLYMLADLGDKYTIKTLVKPQLCQQFPIIESWGGIPATKREDKNGGSVERICEALSKESKFMFMICPKGTVQYAPWRSGWYYIANKLKCELRAVGLDYVNKNVYVSKVVTSKSNNIDKLQRRLYYKLSKIVPLYPEKEVMKIRFHTQRPTVVDWAHLSNCLCLTMLTSLLIYNYGYLTF